MFRSPDAGVGSACCDRSADTTAIHGGGIGSAAAPISVAKCVAISFRRSFSDSVASPWAASNGRPISTARRTRKPLGKCRCRRASRRASHCSTRGWRRAARRLQTRSPMRPIAALSTDGSGTMSAIGADSPLPVTQTCATTGSSASAASTSAGGTFVPPDKTSVSTSRPVIRTWPSASIAARSPVSIHSESIRSASAG
jgi:hypothetical protein